MELSTIDEALLALKAGKPVLVADDEDRENEGDAIMAAEFANPEWLAWFIRHTSGYLCAPMPESHADRLNLPLMAPMNQDPLRTSYTLSVDAASGVTTGISAEDRATTLRVLADPASIATDLIRPGHILPLRAKAGGVRQRPGHTEATVDLMLLAGLQPVGVIGEMVHDDGRMMRLAELIETGKKYDLPVITIAELVRYLEGKHFPTLKYDNERVDFVVQTNILTSHGAFKVRAYRDLKTGAEHLAWISEKPGSSADAALVRLHSECITGEAFGSLKCECGPQLDAALDLVNEHGGVVIYLRGHEGRGIGLLNKLRAYKLQEEGQDTLSANQSLNLPVDAREYYAAAAILRDLGKTSVRLLTNNPAKQRQLAEAGVQVTEMIPLVVGLNETNKHYLEVKRDKMGHLLPENI